MKNIKKLLLLSAVSVLGLSGVGLNTVMAQDSDTEKRTTASFDITNEFGALEIIEKPIDFVFPTTEIKTGDLDVDLGRKFSITLSDFRPSGDIWNLTAELSPFTLEGTQTLLGADIIFTNVSPRKLNQSIDSANPTIGEDDDAQIRLSSAEDASSKSIASAESSLEIVQGKGPWAIEGDVSLHIPALQSSVGDHVAKITWVLSESY